MTETTYIGEVGQMNWRVYFICDRDSPQHLPQRRALPLRLDLANHSPDGVAWGYGGSGPAQLALALCAHVLGDDALALATYQRFKSAHVATWPKDEGWTFTFTEICQMIKEL